MINRIKEISQDKAARIAGTGYLIIIAAGIFAEFFVRSSLIVPGNTTLTARNIVEAEWLFRFGIAGDIIMLIFDVVVAMALYVLFVSVNKSIILLATFFRLVHSAVYGVTLLTLFIVLLLLSGAEYLTTFETEQLHSLVLLFLNAHSTGYLIGLIFFGVHCGLLGYLVIKSGFLPKILGILLLFASIGYLTDSFANFLLPNYIDYKTIFEYAVFIPAFIGELSFCLWLLFKGVNLQLPVNREAV